MSYKDSRVVLLGLDPGFAALGWAAVCCENEDLCVRKAGVLTTAKSGNKHKILHVDDNVRRLRDLYRGLRWAVQTYKPDALCAEAMSYPRNASAAAKVASVWGLLVALCEQHSLPLMQLSPQAVKVALCGVKSASKTDIAGAVVKRCSVPHGSSWEAVLAVKQSGLLEHAYDSIAVAYACSRTDEIRLAVQLSAARI